MFWPFALTGNVATLSGGARLPRIRGPRIGGKGHQSPTTSPVIVISLCLQEKDCTVALEVFTHLSRD